MDGSGSERKRWRKWRGREIPTTDKGSVSFINSLVHCSAAQLIQAVNSCLSHFIGATSHPPCQSWQPSEARKVASYGWGKIEWNRNEWSRMGHWEKWRRVLCSALNHACISSLTWPRCSSGNYFQARVKDIPWWLFTADTSFSHLLCSHVYIESLCWGEAMSVQGPPVWLEMRWEGGRGRSEGWIKQLFLDLCCCSACILALETYLVFFRMHIDFRFSVFKKNLMD